jgi:phosphoribosylformylglycinamidine cyclo-ligase
VLVASVDGVGTKVRVAKDFGWCAGLGRDIVAHCVDDILCVGARPIAFLDYLAFDKLDAKIFTQVLKGIAAECRTNGIELVGGETAEMPGVYCPGEFDLAGMIVGLASRSNLLDGSRVKRGDYIVGLPSNGLHTNGYSLARKVLLEKRGMKLGRRPRGWRQTLGRALLAPHTNYFSAVYPAVERRLVSGIAHITGGGIADNLERILPKTVNAAIRKSTWRVPKVFALIAESGPVDEDEMFRVFNMGLGLLLVVPHGNLPEVMKRAEGSRVVGEIVEGEGRALLS